MASFDGLLDLEMLFTVNPRPDAAVGKVHQLCAHAQTAGAFLFTGFGVWSMRKVSWLSG